MCLQCFESRCALFGKSLVRCHSGFVPAREFVPGGRIRQRNCSGFLGNQQIHSGCLESQYRTLATAESTDSE